MPTAPALPQFVSVNDFSYLHHGYATTTPDTQFPDHLFGGATGGIAPSRLTREKGRPIEQLQSVESMLRQQREDPFTRHPPTINYLFERNADPINAEFISNFGTIQEALETQRLETKGQSSKGWQGETFPIRHAFHALRVVANGSSTRRTDSEGASAETGHATSNDGVVVVWTLPIRCVTAR